MKLKENWQSSDELTPGLPSPRRSLARLAVFCILSVPESQSWRFYPVIDDPQFVENRTEQRQIAVTLLAEATADATQVS